MAKRTVYVDASVSLSFEIDDEAVSEWDGAKILDVLKRDDPDHRLYTPQATLDGLLGGLGIELSVENRSISHIDGWADFPDEAAKGNPYGVDWSIDDVTVGPPEVSS